VKALELAFAENVLVHHERHLFFLDPIADLDFDCGDALQADSDMSLTSRMQARLVTYLTACKVTAMIEIEVADNTDGSVGLRLDQYLVDCLEPNLWKATTDWEKKLPVKKRSSLTEHIYSLCKGV